MKVQFVGSGDAFGSGGRWQTCIRLAAPHQVMTTSAEQNAVAVTA